MRFGRFDDAMREYVITRPDTPLPWINYLGSENFFGLISNTAGGYSFYQDARLRRLTRYRYNNVPLDSNGRYIYIRDDQTGEFWSPAWQPVRRNLDTYECRHGLGYTIIRSLSKDIRSEIRYFIPPSETLEIWDLTLTNQRPEAVKLSVFSAIEFALWDALDDATNYQRNLNTGEVEVGEKVIYHKTEYRERRNHFAFFACSEEPTGYDTQREAFLGSYRGWENPLVVEQGEAANSNAHGWAPMASHHVKVELGPGGSQRIIFLLGYHENPHDKKFDPPGSQTINKKTVSAVIDRYLKPQSVDKSFNEIVRAWDKHLEILQVKTPNDHVDRMVNVWTPYQCMVTFNLSRSASGYESGIGRGIGFRDANQDLLGSVHAIPERARSRLLELAATQFEDGGVYHQYSPLTKQGNNEIGSNFNDDPLWLVLGTSAYIKETGDWKILDELVPFDGQMGNEASLMEHLNGSLRYTLDRLGPHGLPLIGRADWNDCLNLNTFSSTSGESFQTVDVKGGETAESVFIAALFTLAAREMKEICFYLNLQDEAMGYERVVDEMSRKVIEDGWDGEWFLRAYDHRGNKVGSHDCDEGQIFIEPQGMAIMAEIGLDGNYARQALDSVEENLATTHGLMLLQPAYTSYQVHLGEITSYPPGYKENASVFCHTNPWLMIAEAIMGNSERALDYYLRINPSAREAMSEVHRSEPYVYAQMIAGRDAPTHGEAKNSWLTGTAAWNYVAITQWILGVRPSYEGLIVQPVIPAEWQGFKMSRKFRGVDYQITVDRKNTGNNVLLHVDGKPVDGVLVPLPPEGQTEVVVDAYLN